ncbi:hypothetical protein ACIRP3_41735 [Streptomyces sp. NPDC101209]|uniref:hypothetical protein n=1 Tax=Streptomyces sp. NPDC101209 TaxID=3366129 RepID=UPI00382B1706
MTTPPPIADPDPSALTCTGDQVGLCAGCQRQTHRYGHGGRPLRQWCMNAVQEKWGTSVRFTSVRT